MDSVGHFRAVIEGLLSHIKGVLTMAHIQHGNGFLYRSYVVAAIQILISDLCPFWLARNVDRSCGDLPRMAIIWVPMF